jgi:2-polyprenyl-3-methyl-5-hydroxy-6-metoxy-1,4-benzoquinol methylase
MIRENRVNPSKDALAQHIEAIFLSQKIDVPYEIYESEVDIRPILADRLNFTHQYLVCCPSNLSTQGIENFIGKPVHVDNGVLYWFEGDELREYDNQKPNRKLPANAESCASPVNRFSTDLISEDCAMLPTWLDSLLFEKLEAKYAPSGAAQEYNRNLQLSKEKLQVYLGTYFPRSYAESFCIFDNLFRVPEIFDEYSGVQSLRLLDVGAGTGGNLLGLMSAMAANNVEVKQLKVVAIDGNENALAIASSILKEAVDHFPFEINLQIVQHTFLEMDQRTEDDNILFEQESFDFILSSKMINEMIALDNDSYAIFLERFLPFLKPAGLCLLLDITSIPDAASDFSPIMLNNQVNRTLCDMADYQTLLPLPCNLYELECRVKCFSQKAFHVSHSRKSLDTSKVCYRVIGKRGFVGRVQTEASDSEYMIVATDERTATCPYSCGTNSSTVQDGFLFDGKHY